MSQITNINLDSLLDVAQRGVRRASVFLALGVNSARDPRMCNYMFPKDVLIQVLPEGLDHKTVEHFKTEFEKWVVLSGLRDLIETFSVYLDGVHKVGLLIAIKAGDMKPEETEDFERAFEWKGIEDKLKTLKDRFGIDTPKGKYLVSISKARNCLAHRQGIVATHDTDSSGVLRVVWWAIDLFAETLEGREISLMPPLPEEGVILEQGGQIKMRFIDREREFHLGQVLELTTHDLAEICFLVSLAANEVMSGVISFVRSHGIQIDEKIKTEQRTDQISSDDTSSTKPSS